MPKLPLRFALIGAGHIAQSAVIPAFAAVPRHARLVAILSDDPLKRSRLGTRKGLQAWTEGQLHDAMAAGGIDALYIATPNHRHLVQATAALRAGVHVLLEKPMTVTSAEARRLADAAARAKARLMVAYRLHCDPTYVEAVRTVRSGAIGDPRILTASFTMQVRSGNVRTRAQLGGGSVPDLGTYCINAARAFFGAEPVEVRALAVGGRDARSREVDEATSAILRFPGDRIATFTSSFGAASTSWLEVVGTKGTLCLDGAFDESGTMEMTIEGGGRTRTRRGKIGDQFAAEIRYFAECIAARRNPEPGAQEGLRDIRIIEAVQRAAAGRTARDLPPLPAKAGPRRATVRRVRPSGRKAELVHAKSPDRPA